MENRVILNVAGAALIVLFVYTAGSKLYELDRFRAELGRQVFPQLFLPALLIGIPLSELLVVALLAFPSTRRYGFLLSTVLMAVFTLYILGALLHLYSNIPCSCGGVLRKMGWKQHFVFNLVFFGLSLYGLILTFKERRRGKSGQ
ncbi:hypothetical protein J7E50_05405 [Pedobacter sp. ISL-68]|uniref:MauE/DoxX family redox-associated membrane protein n=1 Tax=unclassified Pedobacter TaxID=2628915 RepID=UPI001BEC00C8|nr:MULTISPECIES: MauE/DoxX family redox-associated membrane protein [unclassified Pedobacter]MBT2563752.1 hypothetical protein [Pedobacter sp. ISL-64]MBT2589644.1 hypothetical protein [Pedobacter sp. ISL-68]